MKKLRAPKGTDSANYGTNLYPVDQDGLVAVPDEAVPTLVGKGGFDLIIEPLDVPEGSVILQSSIGAQSCTINGNEYVTDSSGCITVPMSEADALISHSFQYIKLDKTATVVAIDDGSAIEEDAPVLPLKGSAVAEEPLLDPQPAPVDSEAVASEPAVTVSPASDPAE